MRQFFMVGDWVMCDVFLLLHQKRGLFRVGKKKPVTSHHPSQSILYRELRTLYVPGIGGTGLLRALLDHRHG